MSLLKHVSGEKSIDEDVHLLYYDVMNHVDWNYEIHSFGITKCRDDWTWDTEKQPSADYIVSVRINQARTYLKNSNSSIESIASQLGYEDTRFFCR